MDWAFWGKIGGAIVGVAAIVRTFFAVRSYYQRRDEAARKKREDEAKELEKTRAHRRACNLPRRNEYFTGRKVQLQTLWEQFTARTGKPVVLTEAVAGLGGLGKTQLALEYAYAHVPRYEVLWWLRAEQENTLLEDYANLAVQLGLTVGPDTDRRQVMHAVWAKLQTVRLWLLIFDNAENPKAVEPFVPKQGNGDVLITSREYEWAGYAQRLDIVKFKEEESIDFLFKRTGLTDREGAKAIAEALDHLPLALEQTGAYIAGNQLSFQEYLRLYRERQPEMLDHGTPLFYEKKVAATWLINFEALEKRNPAAAELFNLCAFLAPDKIPVQTVREQVAFLPEALGKALADDLAAKDLIADLTRYSLVKHDDGLLYIHRLVQTVARNRMSKYEQRAWVERAVKVLNAAFPYEENVLATWAPSAALLPHVLAVNDCAENVEFTDEPLGRLLNAAGLFVDVRADYSTSRFFKEKALSLSEKNHGQEDPVVATCASHLGEVLHDLGDLKGAKAHYERALRIDEKVYGPDHPKVAIRVNNLGMVLKDLGDLDAAKEHIERAVRIDEKAFGPDHPNVAIRVGNLGKVIRKLGDLQGAKALHERALPIFEKQLGPDHPHVATCANDLGHVLQALGDLKGARENIERAMRIDEKVYGLDHPEVATDANNLGSLLRDLGDLPGAKAYVERAVRIAEKVFGDDHPDTKLYRENLRVVEGEIRKTGR